MFHNKIRNIYTVSPEFNNSRLVAPPSSAGHTGKSMNDLPKIAAPSIAIADTPRRFPVRRIFCVGQNYADHAREMGSDPERQPPFFFTKPADAVVDSGVALPFPPRTTDLHHEIELVIALGAGGKDVPALSAPAMIFGYAAGIDLTRRDLQAAAKKAGRPWDMAKGFDHSAPVGALTLGAPPPAGRHCPEHRRQPSPGRRSQGHDLERRGDHRDSVDLCRRGGRRLDFHGHARGRRSDPARRSSSRDDRRRRADRGHLRLSQDG